MTDVAPRGGVTVSLNKLAASPHYSTTYGNEHGYNARALGSKATHFKQTFDKQYPNPERLRRIAVADRGYDRIGLASVYSRSSHVQDRIQDETGLLGHGNLDNYAKVYAQGQHNTYQTMPDGDDHDVFPPSGIELYPQKWGHPAFVTASMPGCQTRREAAMPPVRWSSRLQVETGEGGTDGLGTGAQASNALRTCYDTTSVHSFSHANYLDRSSAMRSGARESSTAFHPRTLEPLAQSYREQCEKEATRRCVTADTLNRVTVAGKEIDFNGSTRPSVTLGYANFDMTDHIPQYRQRKNKQLNADCTGLGFRNKGPIRDSNAEKMFTPPLLPGDTYVVTDSRAQGQLELVQGSAPVNAQQRLYSTTLRNEGQEVRMEAL